MSQQEIDDALDALEEEHGVIDEDLEEEFEEIEEEEEPKEKPPGYMTYDEWVAKGKDPADFKGENAYKAEYERIQEIRELKETMAQVAEATKSWQEQRESEMREKLEQELARAREEDDVDGAIAAKEKLDSLQTNTAPEPNPVMNEFFKSNPILDRKSSQFDPDFWNDMAMIHDSTIDTLTGGRPERQAQLTPDQIKRSLNVAYAKAKDLHPDKFKSPRNNRRGQPANSKRAVKTSQSPSKLRDVKNTRNPNDANPAMDIYELIKKTDPKAAETFAKNVLGDE